MANVCRERELDSLKLLADDGQDPDRGLAVAATLH